MAYRLEFGDYVFPESLTYNLVSFRSATPSAKLPRAQGARVPRGYLAERRIEIRGLLQRNLQSGLTLQEQLDDLREALVTDTPKTLYLPNDRHLRLVQKDDNGADRYDQTWPERIAEVAVDLITGDPFQYDDTESSDLNNAVDETPEIITIDNDDGNAPAAPELRLTVNATGGSGEIPPTSIAGATEFSVTDGSNFWNYACLNGDAMTVYVDQFGELGLRQISSGIPVAKAAGIVSGATGFPNPANITTNGQSAPTDDPPCYGILRSPESRNAEVSTELAVEGRKELLTCGVGVTAAGWSVTGDHTDLQSGSGNDYWRSIDGAVTAFTVSGANAGVALSATATVVFKDVYTGSGTVDILEVKLIWSFQNAETVLEKTRVTVRVELRNATGSTLTNVRFAYGVDPNPNFTTGSDQKSFNVQADATAFAAKAKSTGADYLGIGVYPSGTNVVGTQIGIVNSISENTMGYSPETLMDGGNSILLGSGTNATYYVGTTPTDTTTNYQTDTTWDAALYSATNSTQGLLLLSPEIDIGAGQTEVFEFYFFTDSELEGGDVELDALIENLTTGDVFTLQGSVPDGTVIKVNTLDETVKIDDTDRMDLFDGLFPLLAVGENEFRITEPNEAVSNLDAYWRSRWY